MRLARMGRVPGASAGVRAVVERLVNVLEHTEKGGRLAFAIDVPAALHLAMQEEHLSEVVGAVLENAVNYARRQVRSEERRVGQSVSVRLDLGGRRILKKKRKNIIDS